MADIEIYSDDILAIGAIYKDHAVRAADVVGVDHATVIGAILEEVHDSTEPGSWKRAVVNALPNFRSDSHEEILDNYNYVESLTPQERYQMGNFEKLQNPVMLGRGDGYFKPHTAITLLKEYNSQYPDTDPLNLKRFDDDYASMTRELESRGSAATANFTALMVRKSMDWGGGGKRHKLG